MIISIRIGKVANMPYLDCQSERFVFSIHEVKVTFYHLEAS